MPFALLTELVESRVRVDTAHPKDPVLAGWFGGQNTLAGTLVTPDNAEKLTAVYSAVSLISEALASLPLHLMQTTQRGDQEVKNKARRHPLYRVLHDQPNRWQTAFEYRDMQVGHLLLRGNAYSEIIPGTNTPVAELVPLHPDRVLPFWAPDGSVAYEYSPLDGPKRILLQDEVHHVRDRTKDGLTGVSRINLMAESLGLTRAAEEFGATYFGNGTAINGVLETDQPLSDEAYDRLKRDWEDRHRGPKNANRPVILEQGMEWKSMSVTAEQAQFLETRRFQVAEVARMFRVPPHMIADVERSTSWGSGIEEQGIAFVTYTLTPLIVRFEQAIKRDLLTNAGRRAFYPHFSVEGLLRGDSKSRAEYYRRLWNMGALTPNHIRELEDLNPSEDEGMDSYYIPKNTRRIEDPDDGEEGGPADQDPFDGGGDPAEAE